MTDLTLQVPEPENKQDMPKIAKPWNPLRILCIPPIDQTNVWQKTIEAPQATEGRAAAPAAY